MKQFRLTHRIKRGLLALATIAALAMSAPVMAHKASDAYLTIERIEGDAVLRVDLALRDLDEAIGIDRDGDATVSWGELRDGREAVTAFVREGILLTDDGAACPLESPRLAVAEHADGTYAALAFRVACAGGALPDRLRYTLLFDDDPLHRGLLSITDRDGSRSMVFSPDAREHSLDAARTSAWSTLRDFAIEGVWHIWIGFDHLLFLAVLLLPAALVGDNTAARRGLEVVKVVSAFTVAHSITLALAALGIVALPAVWVEAAIAASIVLAALANLHPRARGLGWMLAFGFGLIHGFGFAGVLGGLDLPPDALVLALAGFNIGVEAGQLALIVATLPVLLLLGRAQAWRRRLLPAGSLAAAFVGAFWLMERIG